MHKSVYKEDLNIIDTHTDIDILHQCQETDDFSPQSLGVHVDFMHDHLTGGFRVIDISNEWIASFPESVSSVSIKEYYSFVYTTF